MTGNNGGVTRGLAATLLDALPDAVLVIDRELRIRYANRQALSVLGSEADRILGVSIATIVADRCLQSYQRHLEEIFLDQRQSDGSAEVELWFRRGTSDEFSAQTKHSLDSTNGANWLLITIRDVSQQKQVESDLRTNKILLDEAQKLARIGSWRWDLQEDSLAWSEELYRIFGYPMGEAPPSYPAFMNLVHPEDQERVESTIQDAIDRRGSFEIEYRVVRPDGMVRLIFGHGEARVNQAGELVSMLGSAQDITERKAGEAQAFQLALEQAARQEAERTKERFQHLAEVSNVLVASLDYESTLTLLIQQLIPRLADWCSFNTLDDDGQIQRVAVAHRDPEKQKILEWIRAHDFLPHGDDSHPLTQALQNPQPRLYAEVTDDMLVKMARNDEHLACARKLNPTSVMLVPLIARGRAFGVITFGMSDSARRFTTDDLQLAIEIAHRAAVSIDNAQLYAEAQHAARAREEFVSLVSHELKTPLTVIKGYTQVLERYLARPEWERQRILTTKDRLSTQVERLELLVADILDVSRIQRERLKLSPQPDTDLVALISQVMARFDDAIDRRPDHQLRLIENGEVRGNWDPLRLDQVFSNLLSNALKYSPDGGDIVVRIHADEDQAIVRVSDNGVGISVEEQERLFQPFQRGAAATRGIGGTGLGLYITRQIIEQHGGEIWVESEPDSGASFYLSLPLNPEIEN